jgi:ribosomal protein S18 acetylase RimI-like enzyme
MQITRDYQLITAPIGLERLAPTIPIVGMAEREAEEVSDFFGRLVNSLPYYNMSAKEGEKAKYAAGELRRTIARDPEAVLIARLESRLVGFCFSNRDDQTVWLSWFGVAPEHRKSGVGTALLAGMERRARKLNSHKIWCDSRTDNKPSAALLRSRGYSQICILKRHWYGQDFYLWEKFVG